MLAVGVVTALLGHAVTAVSIGGKPLVYRAVVNANDLEGLEGIATPGSAVHLYMRQRNFKDGTPDGTDRFDWCAWKNRGKAVFIASTWADQNGVFRYTGLRANATTVSALPCVGRRRRVSRRSLHRAPARRMQPVERQLHDARGADDALAERAQAAGGVGAAMGRISNAYQASISVADGPNDGPSSRT
jgi:hypothetical protein